MNGLYQSFQKGETISGYTNVYFNPLYVEQLAEIIYAFCTSRFPFGIYHIASTDVLSKYKFLYMIMQNFNFNALLLHKSELKNTSKVMRPLNTTLCIDKLLELNIKLDMSINNGLQMLVKNLKNNYEQNN